MACSLIWPSLFCYYADVATTRLSSIAYYAYETTWNDYPLELQKYMILIIARSQEPVYYTGFNFVNCTLQALGKVFQLFSSHTNSKTNTNFNFIQILKSSCSYYVVFRSVQR